MKLLTESRNPLGKSSDCRSKEPTFILLQISTQSCVFFTTRGVAPCWPVERMHVYDHIFLKQLLEYHPKLLFLYFFFLFWAFSMTVSHRSPLWGHIRKSIHWGFLCASVVQSLVHSNKIRHRASSPHIFSPFPSFFHLSPHTISKPPSHAISVLLCGTWPSPLPLRNSFHTQWRLQHVNEAAA